MNLGQALPSPRGSAKKVEEIGGGRDSQAKAYHHPTRPASLWKRIATLQRLFQLKNPPHHIRQIQLSIILVFLVLSLWYVYRCGKPGGCSGELAKPRNSFGEGAVDSVNPFYLPSQKDVKSDVPNPFGAPLPTVLARTLSHPFQSMKIPVVQFYQRPGSLPCQRKHYIYRNLKQARKLNDVVYFIGPEECREMAKELDIYLEPYPEYQDVIDWFTNTIGKPIGYQVRWFVLRAFMERHAFPRVFYTDSDVMLFANITELVKMLYPKTYLALAVRWPSLKPPLSPSQYVSTAVSGHVSLWTHDAIADFSNFFIEFFANAVLFGKPGDKSLVGEKAYNDMVPLGWYTFRSCWNRPPAELHPQCASDKQSGVTPERSERIRGKFNPKYAVESLCQPRVCNATSWVKDGWCVFDNNFSVQTPKQYFRYRPDLGMLVPTSLHYTHFEDWGDRQTEPVQFLGVHFQAHKKGYLSRGDDPAETWGSSED